MSTKARELRKRLKQKEEAENEKDKPAVKLKTSQTFQEGKNNKMLFKGGIKDRDSYIDPLEYFKKEHLIIKEDKMDEYALDDDDLEEGGNKDERPKTKGGIMMMGMPMPMGGQKGGMGFKINFEEMMKARSKIKKEPGVQRPSSVKSKKAIDDDDEEPKKRGPNDEQNLYIKLVMARNKYSEVSSAKTNVYDKIIKKIKEFREFPDLPPKYMEKVDEFESKLKIPDRLILDPDVQEIENDSNEKIVENSVNLEEIINSLNLSTAN